jgi:hypothetical protein
MANLKSGLRESWFRVGAEVGPTAAIAVLTALLAWRGQGSVAAGDWLGYAIVATLVLAVVLLFGSPRRLSGLALAGVAGLVALAAWTALSLTWAPLPSLARDEALLTLLYATVFVIPLVTLRTPTGRRTALAALVAALGVAAIATAVEVRFGDEPLRLYAESGRLYFPLTYVNAQAAFALVGFWPAIAIAARQRTPVAVRAAALGLATAMAGVAALTQSRGAAIALLASTVVVLALVPARLRLAIPALVPLVLVGIAFERLTEPFDAQFVDRATLAASIPPAGEAVLWIAFAGTVAGLLYVVADRRLNLSPATTQLIGRGAALLVLATATLTAVLVFDRVDAPREELRERWEQFKHEPTVQSQIGRSTHFLSPGSNRYDFWRVALLEFRDHPVAGTGARGFGPAYLIRGESEETPARTHSLPLESLAETGVVGFLLLALGVGAPIAAVVRRRARVPAAAAIGASAYWLAHAAVDWTWTFPACGIPFFLLLGIAIADTNKRLPQRWALAGGGACVLVAALLLAPPWLAARYTDLGAEKGLVAGAQDLSRARTLDPLSTAPLYIEADLAPTPAASAAALREIVEQEPRSVRAQYRLGLALLDAGRNAEARRVLLRARALFPRERLIQVALARANG